MSQTAPVLNQTAAATFSATIVVPAGVKVGDYMRIAAGGANTTTPAGWTQLFNDNSAGFAIYGKWAAAGDPGSTVSLTQAPYVIQFDSWTNVGADPIVVGSVGSSSGSNVSTLTVAAPQVTTADANCAVVETWFGENQFGSGGVGLSVSSPATATQAATVYATGVLPQNVEGLFSGYQAQAAAGLSTSESATFTWSQTGASSPPAALYGVAMALPPIQAPAAPTITAPANASYEDTPITVAWTCNPTQGDGAQSAVAIRAKISGASSYSYWSMASNAWQSTIVWNPYTSDSYTFPAAPFTEGDIYNLSVATEEATEQLQSTFPPDVTFTCQAPPTVTVTAPTGTIATATPTVTATITPASGASVTAYRVVVYTAAQVAASGFTPGGTPNVYDSGTVASTSTSVLQPVTGLSSNNTFYAYVEGTETGGESVWGSAPFAVSFDAPAQPTVTATPGTDAITGAPVVTVQINGHDNLLSTADASFEGSVGTWVASNACTLATSTSWALDGSDTLQVSATGSDAEWSNAQTAPVVAGQSYVAVAAIGPQAAARTVTSGIEWNTGAVSGSTWAAGVATATGHATFIVTPAVTAPPGATSAGMVLACAASASGDVFDMDCPGIFPGDTLGYQLQVLSDAPAAYWPLDDAYGATTVQNVVGSGDGAVHGGVTFGEAGVIASDASQTAALFDGSSGYVDLAPSATVLEKALTAWTVEAWVRPTSRPEGAAAISASYSTNVQWELGFGFDQGVGGSSTLKIGFYVGSRATWYTASDTADIPVGDSVHVAGTWDGTTLSLYKNGVLVTSTTPPAGTSPAASSGFYVGKRHDGNGSVPYFPGDISHAAVYPAALSAARIKAHYDAALNTAGQIVQKWTRGGLVGSTTTTITYTDSAHPAPVTVRDGSNIAIPTGTQQVTVVDHEPPITVPRSYTATVSATV